HFVLGPAHLDSERLEQPQERLNLGARLAHIHAALAPRKDGGRQARERDPFIGRDRDAPFERPRGRRNRENLHRAHSRPILPSSSPRYPTPMATARPSSSVANCTVCPATLDSKRRIGRGTFRIVSSQVARSRDVTLLSMRLRACSARSLVS